MQAFSNLTHLKIYYYDWNGNNEAINITKSCLIAKKIHFVFHDEYKNDDLIDWFQEKSKTSKISIILQFIPFSVRFYNKDESLFVSLSKGFKFIETKHVPFHEALHKYSFN